MDFKKHNFDFWKSETIWNFIIESKNVIQFPLHSTVPWNSLNKKSDEKGINLLLVKIIVELDF